MQSSSSVAAWTAAGGRDPPRQAREAQILSVVAGVRGVVTRPAATRAMAAADRQLLDRFLQHPEDSAAPLGRASAGLIVFRKGGVLVSGRGAAGAVHSGRDGA